MTLEEFRARQAARTPEEVQRHEELRKLARARIAMNEIAKECVAMPVRRFDSVDALFAAADARGAAKESA
jgi:hypothetical protein